jgi:hypothetical protein
MATVELAAKGQGVVFNGQHFMPDADGKVEVPDEVKEYLESQHLTVDTVLDANLIPEETPNLHAATGATALVPEDTGGKGRRGSAKPDGSDE